MQTTTNYELKKPELTDNVKISDFNENADIIDTQLKALADAEAAHLAENAQQQLSQDLNIIDLAVNLETLKGATLTGVTANIFVETFQNLNDITLTHGVYDAVGKRVYL